MDVWPDNERALALFRRVGTRWVIPGMGGVPHGLRWEAIYPLMDRMELQPDEWDLLHGELMAMEEAAISTMREYAPKPKH